MELSLDCSNGDFLSAMLCHVLVPYLDSWLVSKSNPILHPESFHRPCNSARFVQYCGTGAASVSLSSTNWRRLGPATSTSEIKGENLRKLRLSGCQLLKVRLLGAYGRGDAVGLIGRVSVKPVNNFPSSSSRRRLIAQSHE